MQEAVYRLNANGEGNKIVTERFEVVEQVHDCRVLFEQLQASLSSSWDHYFSEASIYYAEHGSLNIPKRYTTPAGLSLGEWLTTQRRVRAGQIPGNLTEQQIARLDSIGMEWGNRNDAAWERGLEEARKFREQFGNLQVPAKYKTKDDYPLGKWINNARKRRNDGKLTEERIRQLNQLGMAWKVFDVRWEQGYALAAVYAQEYGNLDVPRDYKTADGKTLGRWIQNQELAYEQKKLSADQIKRLETIGMQWGSRYDRQWNEVYQAAKRYFEANGNLDIPVAYISPEAMPLENGCGGSSMHIGIRRRAMRFYHKSALSCWMPLECSGRNRTRGSTGTSWRRNIKEFMGIWIFRQNTRLRMASGLAGGYTTRSGCCKAGRKS